MAKAVSHKLSLNSCFPLRLLALLACFVGPLDSTSAQSDAPTAVTHVAPFTQGWLRYANPADRLVSLRLEYLHWWMSKNDLPHLVTTSPPGTPVGEAGVLGRPGTETLFGNEGVDGDGRSGFRGTLTARLAAWFDLFADTELQLHVKTLGHHQDTGQFAAQSSGDPILARPFFDVEAGSHSSRLIAYPGLAFPDPDFPLLQFVRGRVDIDSSSDFYSAGVLLRHLWRQTDSATVHLLAGYQYLQYEESLTISESRDFADPTQADTGTADSFDFFDSSNEFHGGEIGADVSLYHSLATLQILAKVAIGNVNQVSTIDGETVISTPDPTQDQTLIGGLLTAPSNIGRHTNNRFGMVPEFGFTLRVPASRSVAVHVGYTLIAFPHVLRTGTQIDTSVELSQTAESQRPRSRMDDSTLWIQGIHIGAEF